MMRYPLAKHYVLLELIEDLFVVSEALEGAPAGDGFDAPDAGGDAAFRDDLEQRRWCRWQGHGCRRKVPC